MFKLAWTAIVGGGPWEWAALALGVVLVLGGAFGAGALWQASRDVKAAVSAAPAAVAAQHDHDVKNHNDAVAGDAPIKAADKARDDKLTAILAALAAKPKPLPSADPQKSCAMTPDVVELLNDAAH